MAEDFVTRNQHRADLAELRLELANTLASLDKRTELIAQDLARRTDLLTQELIGRTDLLAQDLARRTDLLAQELGTLRRDMEGMRTDLRQEMRELRQEMRELRSTTQRQLWTMIGVVTFAVLTGVIKLVFFP